MEKGENEKETAKREVLEETWLNITFLDGFKTRIEYKLPEGRIKEVIFFIGKISDRILNSPKEEIHEFKWLTYDNMLNLLTYQNRRKALMEVNRFLNNLNSDK
ncbi:NUDIX domain-containing protein [Clostridium sp. DL-VIII]|uniref:NUDIX domain-containing protein n=1 Tax=Clostridium sp. DL-VIII TaxID=641107 RepID=UPI0002E5B552|nr:NUDIX domain-containing protein [Clostridium sp. DL-VIII]